MPRKVPEVTFQPPMETIPQWMVKGQKHAMLLAKRRIQYLTAIAQVAIANK